MKGNESFYPGSKIGNPHDRNDGITIREKLVWDYCMAHFSNPDSLQQYAKNNLPNKVTIADYQRAILNGAFDFVDEFIKKSNESLQS